LEYPAIPIIAALSVDRETFGSIYSIFGISFLIIFLSTVWLSGLFIYKAGQKLTREEIDIYRLKGKFKTIRKAIYKVVASVPLIGKKKKTFVYRVHDEPNIDKLALLQGIISKFGYRIDTNTKDSTSRTLNKLLSDVHGKAEALISF